MAALAVEVGKQVLLMLAVKVVLVFILLLLSVLLYPAMVLLSLLIPHQPLPSQATATSSFSSEVKS
jgi:hypothetical protein